MLKFSWKNKVIGGERQGRDIKIKMQICPWPDIKSGQPIREVQNQFKIESGKSGKVDALQLKC